jgi:hypothetical protein
VNTLDTVGLIAVIIALVLVRSLTWRAMRPGKLLAMPAILGALGLALVAQTVARSAAGGGRARSTSRSWWASSLSPSWPAGRWVG